MSIGPFISLQVISSAYPLLITYVAYLTQSNPLSCLSVTSQWLFYLFNLSEAYGNIVSYFTFLIHSIMIRYAVLALYSFDAHSQSCSSYLWWCLASYYQPLVCWCYYSEEVCQLVVTTIHLIGWYVVSCHQLSMTSECFFSHYQSFP
jgi:hypothetical protein